MKHNPTTNTVRHFFTIPAPLFEEVQELLYSPLEQRVPYGAWGAFLVPLIQEALAKHNADAQAQLQDLREHLQPEPEPQEQSQEQPQ